MAKPAIFLTKNKIYLLYLEKKRKIRILSNFRM